MIFIISIYILGCIGCILDMAYDLNEASDNKLGFVFSIIYIVSKKQSWNYILKSWYYLHK